ncbi:MAG: HD-GYP domain-containing protein [Zoogloeaceae bacterium]|nr:HD-GYP domain-containing protein [Rhodocyclaceae bacterium]MCP5234970.1 HD-GYP domain-containing protein [Zoogloeaceae bacterium]
MKEIVASEELTLGMFVADLDRPWIDSPFLLQGFLIEDEDTLAQLRGLCRFVSVDRARSVGDAHRAPKREDVSSTVGGSYRPRERAEPAEERAAGKPVELPDFVQILRMIRGGQIDQLPVIERRDIETEATDDEFDDRVSGSAVGEPDLGANRSLGRLLDPLKGVLSRLDRSGEPDGLSSGMRGDAAQMLRSHASRIRERTRVERELVYVAPRFAKVQQALEKVLDDVCNSISPDIGALREGIDEMVRSIARNPDALIWLTRLKATDEGSYQHSLHTSVHMMVFGRSLGMGDAATQMLGLAGMLHDVGKIRLPSRLLAKNAKLTPMEYEIFKTHVDYSMAILRELAELPEDVLEIVHRHHERFDGSGYPQGLAGDAIGMAAEIAGLVDSYTAMTSKREYSAVFSTHQALEDLIRLRGSRHREGLVDQFIQCIGIYPVGSLVELNSGEVGVVIGQNRVRRLKPRVMVLLAPDKSQNTFPPVLDLLYDPVTPSGEPYAIVRSLPSDAYGIDPQEFYLG